MLCRLLYTWGGDSQRAMALWGTLYPTESGVTSFEREIFLLKRYLVNVVSVRRRLTFSRSTDVVILEAVTLAVGKAVCA